MQIGDNGQGYLGADWGVGIRKQKDKIRYPGCYDYATIEQEKWGCQSTWPAKITRKWINSVEEVKSPCS